MLKRNMASFIQMKHLIKQRCPWFCWCVDAPNHKVFCVCFRWIPSSVFVWLIFLSLCQTFLYMCFLVDIFRQLISHCVAIKIHERHFDLSGLMVIHPRSGAIYTDQAALMRAGIRTINERPLPGEFNKLQHFAVVNLSWPPAPPYRCLAADGWSMLREDFPQITTTAWVLFGKRERERVPWKPQRGLREPLVGDGAVNALTSPVVKMHP